MSALMRTLLVSSSVAVILSIVTADEVMASTVGPTPSFQSQTKETEEPEKINAHEQMDGSMLSEDALLEATTPDMFPISFDGADRSLTKNVNPGGSSHSESSNSDLSNSESQNSDSFNNETTNAEMLLLREETPGGPAVESPAESVESQENVDPEVESEEVLTSPSSFASLK